MDQLPPEMKEGGNSEESDQVVPEPVTPEQPEQVARDPEAEETANVVDFTPEFGADDADELEGEVGSEEGAEPVLTPEEEIADLRDKWMRAAAEVENIRKRSAKEREAVRARERHNLLQTFLPILDNLRLAISVKKGAKSKWIEGVAAVVTQFENLLGEYGVEAISSDDKTFDPQFHEAVATAHVPGQPAGTILEVVQAGYRIKNGAALRPAKVVVARDQ